MFAALTEGVNIKNVGSHMTIENRGTVIFLHSRNKKITSIKIQKIEYKNRKKNINLKVFFVLRENYPK